MSSQDVEQGLATRGYLDYLAERVEKSKEFRGNEKRTYLRRNYLPGAFVLAVATVRGEDNDISVDLEKQTAEGLEVGLDDEVLRDAKRTMFEWIAPDLVDRNARYLQELNSEAHALVLNEVASKEQRVPGLGFWVNFVRRVVSTEQELNAEAALALNMSIGREVKS